MIFLTKEKRAEIIERVVCDYFDVTPDELRQKTRKVDVVEARHIAMYLIKDLTRMSQGDIAALFNRGKHTTVFHACNKIKGFIKVKDPQTMEALETIEGYLFVTHQSKMNVA